MSYPVVILSQSQFASSASFNSMVQVFVLLLLAFVVLLLLILIGTYANTVRNVKRKIRLTQSIKEATEKAMSAKSDVQAHEILESKEIFTRRGLAVLAEVFATMSEKDQNKLKTVLSRMEVEVILEEQLKSDNEDFLIELMNLTGELELTNLSGAITDAMMMHRDNPDVQFEAFLALSRLGCSEKIVQICKDKDFVITLSFRSLQEIIKIYTGDKTELFKELLYSADAYIARICIKEIGANEIHSLATNVEAFLDSANINLKIDAMRTLSGLKYRPAIGKIKTFLDHERWEVRCVAVSSLACIDARGHIDELIKALQDSEWQVRYNAGSALSALDDPDGIIRDKVAATEDKFAIDMMKYMNDLFSLKGETT